MMPILAETYWQLLFDIHHWLFELTLIALVDGLIIGLGWRWFQRRWIPRHDIEVHGRGRHRHGVRPAAYSHDHDPHAHQDAAR